VFVPSLELLELLKRHPGAAIGVIRLLRRAFAHTS